MNSKRKTMLVAALVVAVVAAAGIGYATVSGYTATTSISSNTVGESQYLTIYPTTNPSAAASYSAVLNGTYSFNTNNVEGTVTFSDCKLNGTTAVTDTLAFGYASEKYTYGGTGYTGYKVGDINITVGLQHSANKNVSVGTTFSEGGYTIGTNGVVDLIFTKTIGTGNEAVTTMFAPGDAIELTGAANSDSVAFTITAYLVVPNSVSITTAIAGTNGSLNATISFTATAASDA